MRVCERESARAREREREREKSTYLNVATLQVEYVTRLVRGHHVARHAVDIAYVPDILVLALNSAIVVVERELENATVGLEDIQLGL